MNYGPHNHGHELVDADINEPENVDDDIKAQIRLGVFAEGAS